MYVVLSGCEDWSLVVRQGYRLVKPESKAPSIITGLRQGKH